MDKPCSAHNSLQSLGINFPLGDTLENVFSLWNLHSTFAALRATILKGLGHMTIEWLPDETPYYVQNMAAGNNSVTSFTRCTDVLLWIQMLIFVTGVDLRNKCCIYCAIVLVRHTYIMHSRMHIAREILKNVRNQRVCLFNKQLGWSADMSHVCI